MTTSKLLCATILATMLISPAAFAGGDDVAPGNLAGDMPRDARSSHTWASENTYWRGQYSSRPYYSKSRNYSMYEPAYRYGIETYNRNPNARYEDLDQSELRRGWESSRGNSNLSWTEAQAATRDAYKRLYEGGNNMAYGTVSTSGKRQGKPNSNMSDASYYPAR